MKWITDEYMSKIRGVDLIASKDNPFPGCDDSAAPIMTNHSGTPNVRHDPGKKNIARFDYLL
jgi:hypothetical protein